MKKCLYMLVTQDKFRLPLAVADTPEELAQLMGVKENSVVTQISKIRRGKIKKSKYEIVFIDAEELA